MKKQKNFYVFIWVIRYSKIVVAVFCSHRSYMTKVIILIPKKKKKIKNAKTEVPQKNINSLILIKRYESAFTFEDF